MPSGMFGTPVASEKRTVTGTVWPSKITARLSAAACGVPTKLPSATTPFAWFARKPGCLPNAVFIASTICSVTGGSSARAGLAPNSAAGTSAEVASSRAAASVRVMIRVPFQCRHQCASGSHTMATPHAARYPRGARVACVSVT